MSFCKAYDCFTSAHNKFYKIFNTDFYIITDTSVHQIKYPSICAADGGLADTGRFGFSLKYSPEYRPAFQLLAPTYKLLGFIPRQFGEGNMLGLFEYKLDGNGDAFSLDIKMDSVSAKALARVDRYINWSDVLKLTENDPEAAKAAERLHTVLQHLGQ